MTDQPAFEFRDADGKSYRIWANGQTDGFDALKSGVITNRIPVMIDRARIEGRRMAHFPEKAEQDAKNLREAAKMIPASSDRHRNMQAYLNELAGKLEAVGLENNQA